jgi:PAS domain S-box-containing protein
MNERLLTPGALVSYVFWGLLLLGIFLTSRYSYLFFHSIAGFFSVVIATGVFAVAWNARHFQENNYLLFLGVAYLFVGALDLLYTLSYPGMGIFPGFGQKLPTHLWFAARTLESISLFMAPQVIGRRFHPYKVMSGYILAFTAIVLIIFVWRLGIFNLVDADPVLTALKNTGKYVSSVFLLGAMALLWRQGGEFDPGVLQLLLGAIALALASEIALTFMAGVSAHAGLVGHLLKIASLYLIYRALIAAELIKPYNRLIHNLRLSSEVVRQEKDFAERLIEMAQVIVLVLDEEGRILRLNRMCEAITGYTLADVKNQLFWEVFPAPEEVDEVQEAFFDLIAGDFSQSWHVDWVARDGTRRLISWSNTAFTREDGSVEYVIGTGIDISEQREVKKHLHRLNGRLEQQIQKEPETRKMEAPPPDLNNCTNAILKDFRVPLRWLQGYCRALEEHSTQRLDVRGRHYIFRIHGVIRQMGEHVETFLEDTRLGQAKMRREEVDLSLQARLIAEDLQHTAPTRRVQFIVMNGLTAAGDPTMLRSVLKKLLVNAWKFTEEVPRGLIEFGALPVKDCCKGFFVRDNRTDFGIHYGHKLFRSFQRLHKIRDFSGYDISLSTVRNIILRHGGRIWSEGAMGQGVTFYFTLPYPPPTEGNQPNPN